MKKHRQIRDFDFYIDEYMYNCRSRKLRPKTMLSYEQVEAVAGISKSTLIRTRRTLNFPTKSLKHTLRGINSLEIKVNKLFK